MKNKFRKTVQLLIVLLACTIYSQGNLDAQIKEQYTFYNSDLFRVVQLSSIFEDSKTFPDCKPKKPISNILRSYNVLKKQDGFDLRLFVNSNFYKPNRQNKIFRTDSLKSMEQHICDLWPNLTRLDSATKTSLIALPKKHIVPGGRFSEIYYWDSYFSILGLMVCGEENLAKDMVDNFSYLIDRFGFIPNANRVYNLSLSQPSFYSLMVESVHGQDKNKLDSYLPNLVAEHDFWMNGSDSLSRSNPSYKRAVLMPDGSILNRYWDNLPEPRQESYEENVNLANNTTRPNKDVYLNIRATCESGWDFSSRWLEESGQLSTIRTTDIIPVDLNSLLWNLENLISSIYNRLGDIKSCEFYSGLARKRKLAISKYLWSDELSFYGNRKFI